MPDPRLIQTNLYFKQDNAGLAAALAEFRDATMHCVPPHVQLLTVVAGAISVDVHTHAGGASETAGPACAGIGRRANTPVTTSAAIADRTTVDLMKIFMGDPRRKIASYTARVGEKHYFKDCGSPKRFDNGCEFAVHLPCIDCEFTWFLVVHCADTRSDIPSSSRMNAQNLKAQLHLLHSLHRLRQPTTERQAPRYEKPGSPLSFSPLYHDPLNTHSTVTVPAYL